MQNSLRIFGVIVALATCGLPGSLAVAQQTSRRFGLAYSGLDVRRQHLVENWVARFARTTGQRIEPGPFYDDVLSMSTKTTFDAVTHALMTTPLTDSADAKLGDALALVAEVDTVRGEVVGASGDRQFRIYVRLADGAIDLLERSQQFRRGVDNSVYHRGYPINYREQGGAPSIQISVASDKRHADIDVDYRSSGFPLVLFNGHLTSSNSDVRAGNNFDRHSNRWTGLQNWWRSFLGVRQERESASVSAASPLTLPKVPRAGKAEIDGMVDDFLKAWLVEGNIVAAMGYISERSYACLARERDDPSTFDRGVAPFQLMANLKSAHDSLGPHRSLDGLVVGTRPALPASRVVQQPHHAQFVIHAMPDDVAASFDCQRQLELGVPTRVSRAYGNYFGATFYVEGSQDTPVALVWACEAGYWKIVSWRVGADDATSPGPETVADASSTRVPGDPAFVSAARQFLERWLVRKEYDPHSSTCLPKPMSVTTSSEAAKRRPRHRSKTPGAGCGQASKHQGKSTAPLEV